MSIHKRSSTHQGQEDANEAAFRVFQQAIGEAPPDDAAKYKNPAAVALGRLGGLQGGRARANTLSAERRIEIAKKAADTRWKRGDDV
jgi:hypothetical protein